MFHVNISMNESAQFEVEATPSASERRKQFSATNSRSASAYAEALVEDSDQLG
jgi:hypothetical protein